MLFLYFTLVAVGKLKFLGQDLSSGLTFFIYLEPHLLLYSFNGAEFVTVSKTNFTWNIVNIGLTLDLIGHFHALAGKIITRIVEVL